MAFFGFFDDEETKKSKVGALPAKELEVVFAIQPTFFLPLQGSTLKKDKELYEEQLGHLGSALLVEDYNANVIVDTCAIQTKFKLQFPLGALLSGSYVMHVVAQQLHNGKVEFDDVDIYFKNKVDAQNFVKDNKMHGIYIDDNPMCGYGHHEGQKFNLIYGVEYDSPEHLISRFDIRACSLAIDPNAMTLHAVRGAAEDVSVKKLVFNPVPRGCSLRRYAKYVSKGYTADSHQNMFFVELLKTDIYKPELELLTKEY